MFPLLDLHFVLCSHDLDILQYRQKVLTHFPRLCHIHYFHIHAQRIMGFILITHKSVRWEILFTWLCSIQVLRSTLFAIHNKGIQLNQLPTDF